MALRKYRQLRAVHWHQLRRIHQQERSRLNREYSVRPLRRYLRLLFLLAKRAFLYLANTFRFLKNGVADSISNFPVFLRELFLFCPRALYGLAVNDDFLVIGHRGSPWRHPENTLVSFARALDEGADALELDLCLTRDGQLVVWHDWDPDDLMAVVRQLGLEPDVRFKPLVPDSGPRRCPVNRLTLNQIRESWGYSRKQKKARRLNDAIPTLEDVLTWAVNEPRLRWLFLDIKAPEDSLGPASAMALKVDRLLKQFQPSCSVALLTPHETILEELKKTLRRSALRRRLAPDVVLPEGLVLDPEMHSAVARAIRLRVRVAAAGRPTMLNFAPWSTFRRLMEHDVRLKRKHNRQSADKIEVLAAWTINRVLELRCLLALGVDGIMTDRPGRLVRIVNRNRKKSSMSGRVEA